MKTKMLLKDSTHQNKGKGVGILLIKILGSSLHQKIVWRASQRETEGERKGTDCKAGALVSGEL